MRFLSEWKGVCPGPLDALVVDGVARGLVPIEVACDGPALPVAEVLRPGERYVTRGRLVLPRGIHEVRVRYAIDAATAAMIDRADNMGTWTGSAESPEVTVTATGP
jgi:hypothetical protein